MRNPEEEGMPKQRAAKIANSPGASSGGGKKSGSGSSRSSSKQGERQPKGRYERNERYRNL